MMKICGVFLLFFSFLTWSASVMRPFQTARLNSTAGAGVASVLITEAAILNPAGLAVFQESSFSAHRNQSQFQNENVQREADNRTFPNHPNQQGFFIYDNADENKGGIAYITQKENNFERKRAIMTIAKMISTNISMGINYRYTIDTDPIPKKHSTFHQTVLGFEYFYSDDLLFGLIVEDPTNSFRSETKTQFGFSLRATPLFTILGDYGGNHTMNFSKNSFWKAATQVNVYSDLFARYGLFNDQSRNVEGFGWGISWIGPKIGLDFGVQHSKQLKKKVDYLYPKESIVDSSLSVNIRF